MNKKRWMWLSGAALLVLLVGLFVAANVFAQEPTPTAPTPPGLGLGSGRGMGRYGGLGGFFGGPRGGDWTMFDTLAEALGLTPEQLFAELHAGKTLEEIAEAQGVELEAVQAAMEAAHKEAMRQQIAQAVEDGRMSQEQADWLLEGIEKGYTPMGRGFGPGRGRGGRWGDCPCAGAEVEPESE